MSKEKKIEDLTDEELKREFLLECAKLSAKNAGLVKAVMNSLISKEPKQQHVDLA